MEQELPKSVLAELVAGHLQCEPDAVQLQRCATGKHNQTWFVVAQEQPLVLRLAPADAPHQMLFYEYRMMRQEPELHRLLRAQTEVPVPEIVAFDFSREQIDRDFLLMQRLPGTPLSDHAHLDRKAWTRVLRRVGQSLGQVHAITGERYGYCGSHHPMEPQADWPSAFQIMWNKLLEGIAGCGGYTPEDADFMRRQLERHLSVFDRPIAACLLHMDVWAQNLLADEQGQLTGVLDWDRALWGDPEIEFAVLDYCGISEASFWEGYAAPRETSPEAELRRTFYLLYEMQKYIFIRLVRRHRSDEANRFRRYCLEMAQSLR